MTILVRLVLNGKFLKTISRFCATLSAIGRISIHTCIRTHSYTRTHARTSTHTHSPRCVRMYIEIYTMNTTAERPQDSREEVGGGREEDSEDRRLCWCREEIVATILDCSSRLLRRSCTSRDVSWCTSLYAYAHLCVYLYMYVCVCVYICFMYLWVYIYIYVWSNPGFDLLRDDLELLRDYLEAAQQYESDVRLIKMYISRCTSSRDLDVDRAWILM